MVILSHPTARLQDRSVCPELLCLRADTYLPLWEAPSLRLGIWPQLQLQPQEPENLSKDRVVPYFLLQECLSFLLEPHSPSWVQLEQEDRLPALPHRIPYFDRPLTRRCLLLRKHPRLHQVPLRILCFTQQLDPFV